MSQVACRSLTLGGGLCPPEDELPSWVSPNQTLPACLVLSVCQGVLLPLQTGKPKGRLFSSFFSFNLTACSGYERLLSLACLLNLRLIFRVCWIQATYFLTHTHTRLHVCRPHRYAWHAHKHTHARRMGSRGTTLVWPESFFCPKSGISAVTDGEGRCCHPQTLHLLCLVSLVQKWSYLAVMSLASFDVWLIYPLLWAAEFKISCLFSRLAAVSLLGIK